MATNVAAGEGVIAARLEINCKNLISNRRPEVFCDWGVVTTFRIIEGVVTIGKPLPEEERRYEVNACRLAYTQGDVLRGRQLWGVVKPPRFFSKPDGVGTSSGRSKRHSRQDWEVEGEVCLAVITTTWKHENIDPHPREWMRSQQS